MIICKIDGGRIFVSTSISGLERVVAKGQLIFDRFGIGELELPEVAGVLWVL